jgi:hypothetical protein
VTQAGVNLEAGANSQAIDIGATALVTQPGVEVGTADGLYFSPDGVNWIRVTSLELL